MERRITWERYGRTKCYESYSKAPLLEKKWENCDNVLQQANIPQFNRLDDKGTPLRLFQSFFVNMLVDMIVGSTKLYGHREKADTSLENFS